MSKSKSAGSKEPNAQESKVLWEALKIEFRLESRKFPDNKIYGVVDVDPKSSRTLIKEFVLVVQGTIPAALDKENSTDRDGETHIVFDQRYETIAASGLSTERINRSAYVIAKPIDETWANESPKTSKIRPFSFTGRVLALSPTLSFEFPDDSSRILVINWFHLGDGIADQYVMYLDGVDIQYIRRKQINDAFEVKINGFEPGEKHTFQLVAQMRNQRQTYESDLMEFTVPDKEPRKKQAPVECITVSNQAVPHRLPVIPPSPTDSSENEGGATYRSQKSQQTMIAEMSNGEVGMCTTCKHHPHDSFPGMDHYFHDSTDRLPYTAKRTPAKDKRQLSSEVETDDDEHVIASKDKTKTRLALSIKIYE